MHFMVLVLYISPKKNTFLIRVANSHSEQIRSQKRNLLSLFYLKAICIVGCQNMQPKFPFNDQEDFVPILLKKLIFPANFVLIFFCKKYL